MTKPRHPHALLPQAPYPASCPALLLGQALLKAPAAALGRLAGPKKAGFAAAVTLFDGSPVPKGAPPVVLVTGATGGVGKRCVEQLLAKGQRVRALVRDLPKAQELLAPAAAIAAANNTALELAVADVTQERTLLPEMFEGVTSAISCVAVSVAPKEGDTKACPASRTGRSFIGEI